jgi:hypothetical protein
MGAVVAQIHVFLTSALVRGQLSASGAVCFILGGESPDTKRIRRWVGASNGQDFIKFRIRINLVSLNAYQIPPPPKGPLLAVLVTHYKP